MLGFTTAFKLCFDRSCDQHYNYECENHCSTDGYGGNDDATDTDSHGEQCDGG